MLYTPLLPGAAAGTLEPRHVVVPLREQLRRTELHLGTCRRRPRAALPCTCARSAAARSELRYDQLIVALGSTSRTLPIPGLAEHALGFKTLSEAIALRNRLHADARAGRDRADDEAARAALLTYVFVGAGYAGLEGLAELQDFAADVDRALPALPPARAALRARRGARPGDDRDRSRTSPRSRPPSCAGAGSRSARARRSRSVTRRHGRALDRRDRPDAHGRAGPPGVKPHPVVARARAAARRRRPDRGRPLLRRRGPARTCGRSATPRRCPTPPRKGKPVAADRAARAAPGARWPPTTSRARSAGEPQRRRPFRYRTLGVVRRHGPPPGGRQHGRDQVARLPGVVPRPHLPPGADAGDGAARCGSWPTGRSGCCSAATPPSSASSATRPSSTTRGLEELSAGGTAGRRAARARVDGRQRSASAARRRAPRRPSGRAGRARSRRGGTPRSTPHRARRRAAEPDQVEREAHPEGVHGAAAREVQRARRAAARRARASPRSAGRAGARPRATRQPAGRASRRGQGRRAWASRRSRWPRAS